MKKIISIIISISILLSLCSCTSELHEHMIINGFGIDYADGEYILTVRYESLDENSTEQNIVVTGVTVYDAMSKISLISGTEPLYSVTSYIIYGKDVAINGLDTAMDFFIRYFKAKPIINIYISNTTANEIMSAEKDEELISSSIIQNTNEQNKGQTVFATVMSFISDSKSESYSSAIPIIVLDGEELSCTTTAIFQNYKAVDILNEDETKGYLAYLGELQYASIVIDDKISLEIQNTSCKIDVTEDIFTVEIETKVALAALPFTETDIDYEYIEQECSARLEDLINQSLTVLKESNVDFYGLGNLLYLQEREFWQKNSDSFLSNLSDVKIELTVTTKLIRVGEEDN